MNANLFNTASVTVGGIKTLLNCRNIPDFREEVRGLTVRCLQESVSEDSMYRRFSIENQGTQDSEQVTFPYVYDGEIPCGTTVLFSSLHGDDCSENSFLPVRRILSDGDVLSMEPTGGRSSNTSAFPFFDLDLGDGALYFAVGWSGQWKCVIEKKEKTVSVKIGLAIADFYMLPGERLDLPSVFVVSGEDGSSVRRRAKRIIREHYNALEGTGTKLPISIQSYDRYFRRFPLWETEDGQLLTLKNAVKCRYFNTQWLDAAWFKDGFPNGVGNYSFEKGFPNGLRKVSDAAREAGLRFMLWFEPERIVVGSEVQTEHPEFLLSVPGDTFTYCYNLGQEDAWKWLRDTLIAFIRDNGIDNYRQDFNFEPLPYWTNHDVERRSGITEIKYINGLYRLWDEMKEAFPHLLIDNCASGGRRLDFETVRRAVPMWRCDVSCGPITEQMHNDVYDQNQTLGLSEYLPYHACAAWEPVANDVRSAATEGLACTFDILNPDFDFSLAADLLEEVSRLAEGWDGDFYPLTEATLSEKVFAAYELSKKNSGFAVIFRRAECTDAEFLFRPHGIEENESYIVTVTDEHLVKSEYRLSGAELKKGFSVILPEAHTSAVVEYRR